MALRRRKDKSYVKDDYEKELLRIYNILGNPHKRKIILFLGQHGSASASELKSALKISTGTLYYNLDFLEGYVQKDENKRYMLTEKGRKLYELMLREREKLEEVLPPAKRGKIGKLAEVLSTVFIPYNIFRKLQENVLSLAVIGIISLIFNLVGLLSSKLDLIILSFNNIKEAYACLPLAMPENLFIALKLMANLLVLLIACELLTLVFGSRRVNGYFILGICISLIPLGIYPYIKCFLSASELQYTFLGILLQNFALRTLQLLTVCFLTACIAAYKHISKERAFIIASILFYLSIFIEMTYH